MKKLMTAAVAAAVAGGAFAAPLVYDYKASVKHMYEKVQRVTVAGTPVNYYVKYVKTSKLEGYFVQDRDHASLLSQNERAGAALSQKKGFLVLINKSAERNYRTPKIMPAQLDVKSVVTKVKNDGTPAGSIAEAYFYAGPFSQFANSATATWDASQDDGADFVATALATGTRTYGTEGSTLYLFGQHNTYNRYDNSLMPASPLGEPATINAFGDAWMNGAGFGTIGTATAGLCCGWETSAGGSSVRSISGNLKGGLFLCSIGGELANGWYFALGLEDLYKADDGNTIGRAVHGNLPTAEVPGFDEYVWADGELALSTTDVVSGSWTLKPAGKKFQAAPLTTAEAAWAGFATILATPAGTTLLQNIKAANTLLDKNYSLTTDTEPSALAGQNTKGLISPAFATLYL